MELTVGGEAIKAFLLKHYPREDVALRAEGQPLGWWVWENGSHTRYSLKSLAEVWGDTQGVQDFVGTLKKVETTFIQIFAPGVN
jgi:hypothetical protein